MVVLLASSWELALTFNLSLNISRSALNVEGSKYRNGSMFHV